MVHIPVVPRGGPTEQVLFQRVPGYLNLGQSSSLRISAYEQRRSTICARFSLNPSAHSSIVEKPENTSPGDRSRNCTRAASNRS